MPVIPFPLTYWVIPGKILAGHVPSDKNIAISEQKILKITGLHRKLPNK
jgi:hypothetical protein